MRGPHDVIEYAHERRRRRAGRRDPRHRAGPARRRRRPRAAGAHPAASSTGDARPSTTMTGPSRPTSADPHAVPDADRPLRPYGGRFVPEALVAALDELDAAYDAAKADPAFAAELDQLQRTYTGRPSPLTEATPLRRRTPAARTVLLKREDLNHTGSHKINNVLGQALLDRAHGQDAGHRRDRRRSARRRHRDRRGAVRPRVRGLHGRGGHRAARRSTSPGCSCSAPRSSPSPAGSRTLKDAINEAMRDWVTNVDRTHYLLGTVGGPAPVPDDGARLPAGHRHRGPRPGARARPAGCPTPSSPASAAAPTRSASSSGFLDDPERAAVRLRGRRRRRRDRPPRGDDHRRLARRAARRALVPAAGRGRARPSSRTRSRPAWTTRASGPSTRGCTTPAARLRGRSPTPRRWTRSGCSAGPRASSRRSRARTPSPARCELGRELGPDAVIVVNLSGRGDKDVDTAARWFGLVEGERAPEGRA